MKTREAQLKKKEGVEEELRNQIEDLQADCSRKNEEIEELNLFMVEFEALQHREANQQKEHLRDLTKLVDLKAEN